MNNLNKAKNEYQYSYQFSNINSTNNNYKQSPTSNLTKFAHDKRRLSVLIIGGFLMNIHHLKKYEQLYRQYCIDDVTLITPSLQNMTIPTLCEQFARKLLAFLECRRDSVVIHVFSGAVWIYYALNDLAHSKQRNKVKAVIFESTPLDVKPEQFGRFLAWKLQREYRPFWSYPFIAFRLLAGITSNWESRNLVRMESIPEHIKVLFIYSKNDKVISRKYIDQYNRLLKNKGIATYSLALNSARHCLAIRDDNSAYKNAIKQLLCNLEYLP